MNIIKETIKKLIIEHSALQDKCDNMFKGRHVIITGWYNGQPHGSSKKSLKGKNFIIRHAYLDSNRLCFFLEGQNLGIDSNDVEFAED